MRATCACLVLAVVISLVGGCDTGSTANPYAGLPSNACGGFHLKVVNQTGAPVRVQLNGSWSSVVGAGTTEVINQGFSSPRPPDLPWRVVMTDEGTGRQLFAATMPGPVDQKVTLSAGGPAQTPYDLSEDC